MHVIAPAAVLEADPLQHAVAAFPLSEAAAAMRAGGVRLPEGAGRFAVSVDGTEPEEDVAALRVRHIDFSPLFCGCITCGAVVDPSAYVLKGHSGVLRSLTSGVCRGHCGQEPGHAVGAASTGKPLWNKHPLLGQDCGCWWGMGFCEVFPVPLQVEQGVPSHLIVYFSMRDTLHPHPQQERTLHACYPQGVGELMQCLLLPRLFMCPGAHGHGAPSHPLAVGDLKDFSCGRYVGMLCSAAP